VAALAFLQKKNFMITIKIPAKISVEFGAKKNRPCFLKGEKNRQSKLSQARFYIQLTLNYLN
jgi:hypothetical protein